MPNSPEAAVKKSTCIEEVTATSWRSYILARSWPRRCTVCGEYIPPSYDVGIWICATNHGSEYFLSPLTCEPEHWLYSGTDLAKQEQLASAKAAHNPFSLGPRDSLPKVWI
jgi:hypothetical protein